jgi:E3 ubiquitin-protein ligase RNF213
MSLNRGNQLELVYTVFPLPESMFPFVWNFDRLDKNDEREYIEKII